MEPKYYKPDVPARRNLFSVSTDELPCLSCAPHYGHPAEDANVQRVGPERKEPVLATWILSKPYLRRLRDRPDGKRRHHLRGATKPIKEGKL
ncbi:hypothetical protein DPMN_164785 [Dreissena polymorpha]|uniref:Uncharacterized protein n=1 Tax=Dreissena polymorpha TaxID=45954 RepID=A0A9D4EZE0_DREPO|nr:hypothetical protein DPMN_164785 [Dreissena polymorpha]